MSRHEGHVVTSKEKARAKKTANGAGPSEKLKEVVSVTDNFPVFAKVVAESFQALSKAENVFVADLDGDALYAAYLASFPDGTNPLFKKVTEHECSCCRNFIRRVGNVVAIEGDALRTVWDLAASTAPYPYDVVASHLRELVSTANVRDLFRVSQNETSFGAAQTRSLDPDTGTVLTWNHFYTGEVPRNLRSASTGTVCGDYRTSSQVFERGLRELSPDAIETVISLVEANGLYRGEEHKPTLLAFRKSQSEFLAKEDRAKSLYVWSNACAPASRFRNTVIGTLVQDLSEGQDLERAVKSFESKVAPTNYKRTTALITPGMVKKAMETIEQLGLESALERRFATIGDISVNDVKWVDGTVQPLMKGGLGEALMKHAVALTGQDGKDEDRAEDIGIDEFMAKVLPQTTSLELLFKNELVGNLVSLTAPVHPEPKRLFRWSNDFAWSYGGNVADSIKDRVKKAGGNVDALLRVSLSWFNFDDLDLHIFEPNGRGIHAIDGHIYYAAKRGWTGGVLDVDMNAGAGRTREAVENVVWTAKMPDGAYRVVVKNYTQRETSDAGFIIEVESGGKLSHYSYNKIVRNDQNIEVVVLHVEGGLVTRVEARDPGVSASNISQEKWGLKTEQYAKVRAVTFSPNYWGNDATGNKHTLFILDGAKNDEPTRGFYNEFLHPRLEPHRKVFEVIGDKTKCQPTDGQLSGLGFSSTKKESFVVRAQQGKKRRVFNVQVGA